MPRSCSRRRSSVRSTIVLEDQAQALAGVAERVEGAPLDERLHGPLVEHDRVDPLAEVEDVLEGPVGVALGHDALDQALAHVAHRGQAEDDGVRPAPGRLGRSMSGANSATERLTSGTSTSIPMRAALGEVDRRLVLVVLDRGQQRRHVLDRVVRLEPGRLVGHQPVAVGVRLVERVVGERLDDVEELRAELLAVALGRRSRRRTSRARRQSARGSSCRRPCGGCRPPRASSRRTSGPPASPTPGRASARRCP